MKVEYFIYTGNAYPHKNLHRLIETVVLLNKNSDHKIKLYIVSSRNVFTHRLIKYVKNLNAERYIDLLGFVEDEKLINLYKKSIAFIYPSLSEGFGLPGIEAMRAGTLLLASNIPIFKEVYDSNAIYFNPLDFSSIENAMRIAIKMKKEERENRIKKSQEFVKKYSWRKMAEETLRMYKEVVQ